MIVWRSQAVKILFTHQKRTSNNARIKVIELPKIVVANETSLSKVFSVKLYILAIRFKLIVLFLMTAHYKIGSFPVRKCEGLC